MDDKRKMTRRIGMVLAVVTGLFVAAGVVSAALLSGGGLHPAASTDMAAAVPGDLPAMEPSAGGEVVSSGVVSGEPPSSGEDAAARPEAAEEPPPCDFPDLVGKSADEDLLATTFRGRGYRVIPPGAMVTQDFSPARVNLDLDESGLIRRVWCG